MLQYLAQNTTFRSQPGDRSGFDLTKFILKYLHEQFVLEDPIECCEGFRNVFIHKGLIGKGQLNLEKAIYNIVVRLGFDVAAPDCCNPAYSISPTVLTSRKQPGVLSLKDEIKRILDANEVVYQDECCESSFTPVALKTFLGTDTPGYPVGIFNVNDEFVGFAENQEEYVIGWNSDPVNQAIGELFAGDSPLEFKVLEGIELTEVIGLRYYKHTGPANLQLFVGDNDIVRYGSTQKKGSVDGTLITNTTRREWNRVLYGAGSGQKSTVISDTVRTLNCTGYVDSSDLFIFHNEDSEYSAVSGSNGFYTIEGNYPLALRALFYSGRMATVYDNINWSELTNLYSWYNFSGGGEPWGMLPSSFPDEIITSGISNNITQLALGENTSGPAVLGDDYPYANATNFPNLEDLVIIYNTGDALTGYESWFLTMPKVTNLFLYRTQTVTQVDAAVADAVWNNIATALTGVVPTGAVKELRVFRTNNVTAASLASRNALISAGWTVLTN